MCKYCDKLGKKYLAKYIVETTDGRHSNKGMRISIQESDHTIIENGIAKYVEDPEEKLSRIVYLEAREWDRFAERCHNIAVEIKYCPFCGAEL